MSCGPTIKPIANERKSPRRGWSARGRPLARESSRTSSWARAAWWPMTGFGIDLAGYSTGKTSLAVVKIALGSCEATLLRDSALSMKRTGDTQLEEALEADIAVLKRCLAVGRVAVDIP